MPNSIEKIPRRSRISRSSKKEERGVIFSKRGQGAVFVTSTLDSEPQVLSTEDALNYFKADEAEIGVEVTPTFSKLFDFAN